MTSGKTFSLKDHVNMSVQKCLRILSKKTQKFSETGKYEHERV